MEGTLDNFVAIYRSQLIEVEMPLETIPPSIAQQVYG
jgi:hypothetical protein